MIPQERGGGSASRPEDAQAGRAPEPAGGGTRMPALLGRIAWQDQSYDWALEFDEAIRRLILAGDHEAIVHYDRLGQAARLSVPTNEHFLPLLYILALQDEGDEVRFFADKVTLGSISMRSLRIG
jgi:4,5-DOPA dioxygenase extradiol